MKTHTYKSVLACAVLLCGLAGSSCTSDPYVNQGRATGAVLGGAAGAVIGNNTGMGSWGGAAAGAAIGGIMGDTAGKTNSMYHRGRYYY